MKKNKIKIKNLRRNIVLEIKKLKIKFQVFPNDKFYFLEEIKISIPKIKK